MRTFFFIFSFLSLSFQVSAQQNFAEIRKKYQSFLDRKEVDSALVYAFKGKVAAQKEFGEASVNYLRSTNSIGHCYLGLASSKNDRFIDSAKYWLIQTYNKLSIRKEVAYIGPKEGVLLNLVTLYADKLHQADSAIFYLDQFVDLQFQKKQSPQDLINNILATTVDIEHALGLAVAEKYYKQTLEARTAYFGAYSTKLVLGLDSLLRKDPLTNTSNRRLAVYQVMADPPSLKELRQIVDEYDQNEDLQDYFDNLSALNEETLRQEGQKSLRLVESLRKLGAYYLEWFGDREFAAYYFQKAMELQQANHKKNQSLFNSLTQELKSLDSTSTNLVNDLKNSNAEALSNNPVNANQKNNAALRLILPIGHPQGITNAAISPNGKLVYSKSYNDVNIKVWDVATGALIYNLPMVGTPNFALFTADKNFIFAVSGKQLVLWDLRDGSKKWEKLLSSEINIGLVVNGGKNLIITDQTNHLLVLETLSGIPVSNYRFANEVVSLYPRGNGTLLVQTQEKDSTNNLSVFDYTKGVLRPFVEKKRFNVEYAKQNLCIIYQSHVANFDIDNLKLRSSFPIDSGVNHQVLSLDGKKLFLTYDSDSTRAIYDAMSGDLISNTSYNYPAPNFSFLGDGTTYLTHDGVDGGIWKSETGEFVHSLSTDTSARLRRNVEGFINYSDDGKYMLVVFSDNVLRLYDISSNSPSLVREFSGKTSALYVSTFSDDNQYLATKDNEDYIKVIDLNSNKLLGTVEHKTLAEAGIIFDHQNKQLITNSDSSIRIWDLPSLRLRKELKYPGVRSMDISKDNMSLMTAGFDMGEVRVWNLKDFSFTAFKIDSVSSAKYNLNNDQILLTKKERGILLVDAKTKNVRSTIKVPEWDYSTEFAHHDQFILHVTNVAARIFDAASGKLINSFEINNEVNTTGIAISPDGKQILIGEHSGKLAVYDIYTKEKLKEIIAHTAGFRPKLLADGKKLLTCSDDGTIKVWDFENLQLAYQLILFGESDYVIYTPSGYYTASPQASKYLHYVTKDLNVIGFDQLDVKFNRPDRVFAQIGGADKTLISLYQKAYVKRIKKLGVDTASFSEGFAVPEADFEGRENIALEQTAQQIIVRIKGSDPKQALHHFNVWVNDIPLFGMKGKLISGRRKSIDTTITISLSQGKNTLETSIANMAGMESYRKPLVIFYRPQEKITEKVWFVGLGISEFKDNGKKLLWSTSDIVNLDRELKVKYKQNYHSTLLLNKEITLQNLKTIKKMLLDSTGINDKVILSFSGHGLMSKNYDYYLSTYDTDFDRPEKNGLPYEQLEMLLDSIPARKKLMLIDACYSGEIDKEEISSSAGAKPNSGQKGVKVYNYAKDNPKEKNAFELMQLLFNNVNRNTGAVVISASAGNQAAQEKSLLKGGVFTFAVLEMMKAEQRVKISDLKKQLVNRVNELTKGEQIPTIRGDSKNYDWELW